MGISLMKFSKWHERERFFIKVWWRAQFVISPVVYGLVDTSPETKHTTLDASL